MMGVWVLLYFGLPLFSFIIVLLSRKLQVKMGKKHMDAKLELAEGIQECLETIQDIKACHLEEHYIQKLDQKIDQSEHAKSYLKP